MPSPRFLKPLTGPVRRKPFGVLDIESKDGPSTKAGFTRPFMVGVYDGTHYNSFFGSTRDNYWQSSYFEPGGCVDKAMTHILTEEHDGWTWYAHNAGRFDYLFLLPWLMIVGRRYGYTFEIVPTQSSIQVLDVKQRRMRWRFLDSFRLMPTSLDKIAKTFGLEGKLEHDLNLPEEDPSWPIYNKQDCTQLFGVLDRFHEHIETTLGGEVGITAPSTAMKTFRRVYLKDWIPRVRSVHEFVRLAYYGGRVEPFVSYAEGLSYWDFNSSYPAAMLDPMPCSESWTWEGEPPEHFKQNMIGFVECDVYIPEDCYCPPLPLRYNDKLCFPVGKLSGVWDWHELRLIERVGGRVERWGKSVWFEGRPIFREMVLDLYPYRDKGSSKYDEALAQVVKILLNSLYGKFGMKPERRRITILDGKNKPPVGAKPANLKDPDCLVWYSEEKTDQPYIIPQIAAHVTALARIRLWEAMHEVFSAGSFVAYCDTDSMLTPYQFESSNELGKLKNEYPGEVFTGKFIAPKVYVLEGQSGKTVHRAKGLRKAKLEEVLAFAAGETLHFEELEKVGLLAQAGFLRGPQLRKNTRTIRQTAEKRVRTGLNSLPHVVGMW